MDELHVLKRRGFGELSEQQLALSVPALAALARAVFPEDTGHTAPLRKLMQTAVRGMDHPVLRAAAGVLFAADAQGYGKTLAIRQAAAAACFSPAPAISTFRQRPQYTRRIVEELAQALERVLISRPQRPGPAAPAGHTSRRSELADAEALLNGPARVLWLWGQAGMGKTVLAQQLARQVGTHLPGATVRLENSRVAEADILGAVHHDGVDARSWSSAAGRLHLREMLTHGRSLGTVVFDGVTDEDALWELVPEAPTTLVIVTSRSKPRSPVPGVLRIDAYSPSDALAAIAALLPTLPATEAQHLAVAVAHHPLLLDSICRHVLGTAHFSVEDISAALLSDLLSTLAGIDALSSSGTSLALVHERTLAVLDRESAATTHVLAALVWLSSEGTVPAGLANSFLQHRHPGVVGDLQVRATLSVLVRWSILVEEHDAYVIHPLTSAIYRDLLTDRFDQVVEDFFAFLRCAADDHPVRLVGRLHIELLLNEHVLDVFWPPGQSLLCLDADTWLWADRTGTASPIRYEVYPHTIYAITGTGRAPLSDTWELTRQTNDSFDALKALHALRRPAPVEDGTSPSDGTAHYVVRSLQLDDGLTRALCGKKWRRSPRSTDGLPVCPRCTARAQEPVERMLTHPAPSPALLLRKLLDFTSTDETSGARPITPDALVQASTWLDWLCDPGSCCALPELPRQDTLFDMATVALCMLLLAPDAPLAQQTRWLEAGRQWSDQFLQHDALEDHMRAEGLVRLAQIRTRHALVPGMSANEQIPHYQRAVETVRHALAVNPEHPLALEHLQEVLTRHAQLLLPERPAEAELLFREIESAYRPTLASRPEDAEAHHMVGLCLANRATCLRRSDPGAAAALQGRAAEHFTRALKTQPHSESILLRLGTALVNRADLQADGSEETMGLYRQAALVFQQGISLHTPHDPAFERGLSHCAQRLGLAPGDRAAGP
ncbi:DUF3039 domain-containing protein [Streptomyces sp. NBC_01336]|uniref:DUF3039 domain-containing protein n=1 Tax=Streptomyces sp. NBC_01336 TaxID=2903829 RepID=UPI002E0EEB14|nr:DUF3039 domain-containing protein [Streptomyces sp. NBC_01336]